MDPIQCAEKGIVDFFMAAELDKIQYSRDASGTSVLALAAKMGHLDCCRVICERCPTLLYQADNLGSIPLHEAARAGKHEIIEFFIYTGKAQQKGTKIVEEETRTADSTQLLMSGRMKYTALHYAAIQGCLKSVEVLISADPSRKLVKMVDANRRTALHTAAERGHFDMVKLFFSPLDRAKLSYRSSEEITKYFRDLVMKVDNENCTALHYALQKNFLDIAKFLVSVGFEATCRTKLLAVANDQGKTAMQIAMEKDLLAFIEFLLEDDLNFALEQVLSCDPISVGFWRLLGQNKSIRVPQTLLDSVSHKKNLDALANTIHHWRECLQCVNVAGQNILHLATKYGQQSVVKLILGLADKDDEVLNKQDVQGDTPLHIAASGGNSAIIYSLLYDDRVDKLILNKKGKSALDAINIEINKRRAGVYGLIDRVDEKDMKDRSDFDLLVGGLIATVSFTAGISVPGGYFSGPTNQGNAVLHKKPFFDVFIISNTIALVLSLSAVFSHFCTRHLVTEKSIIYQLKVATYCSLGAIFAMMIAFTTGSCAVLANSHWLSTIVWVISAAFFIIACPALWRVVREQGQRGPSPNNV